MLIQKLIFISFFTLLLYIYSSYFEYYCRIVRRHSKGGAIFPPLIIGVATCFLPFPLFLPALGLLVLLHGIYFFCAIIYFDFTGGFFSIQMIQQLQFKSEITQALPSLLTKRLIFGSLIFPLIIFCILIFFAYRSTFAPLTRIDCLIYTGLLFVFILLFILRLRRLLQKYNPFTASKRVIIETVNIWGYHLIDLVCFLEKYLANTKQTKIITSLRATIIYFFAKTPYIDSPEQTLETNNFLKSKGSLRSSDFFGVGKGKNVIIIQLETFQKFILDVVIDGKVLCPNLKKFIEENIELKNVYSQIEIGCTSDAEFLVNNGLYPTVESSTYLHFPEMNKKAFFSKLKSKGYFSSFAHGYSAFFWNRDKVYNTFDDTIYLNDILPNVKAKSVSDGCPDNVFFKTVINRLKTFPEPFASLIVTVSSHAPFLFPKGIDSSPYTVNIEPLCLKKYFEVIRFADDAFGQFIQDLKATSLYDKSIILVYGDHGVNSLPTQVNEYIQKNHYKQSKTQQIIDGKHVVCAIHVPGLSTPDIEENLGLIDMKSTLSDLLGIKTIYDYGHSALIRQEMPVIFAKQNIIYQDYFYLSNANKWYNIKTDEEITSTHHIYNTLMEKKDSAMTELFHSNYTLNVILNSTKIKDVLY